MLVGPNGVGKTNVVEALRYISTLSSHRVTADAPLCRLGTPAAIVRCEVISRGQPLLLEVAINSGRANQLQISGSPVRARDLVGQLRSVMFGPEDLRIVKGDPSDRRDFLDELLIQRAPRYLAVKADYDRVVRQRASLLKSIAATKSSASRDAALTTMDVWNEQLATHGASLTFGRLKLLGELQAPLREKYASIAPGSACDVRYEARTLTDTQRDLPACSIADLSQLILDAIAATQEAEIARGVSLVGPHRDDLHLSINDMPAKTHASHGESWSLALSLRLASYEVLRTIGDAAGDPILILDDVFAELDTARRAALAHAARDAEQVFITAAVPQDVPKFVDAHYFAVSPGTVNPV